MSGKKPIGGERWLWGNGGRQVRLIKKETKNDAPSDGQVGTSGRQLGRQVWSSGERSGPEIDGFPSAPIIRMWMGAESIV